MIKSKIKSNALILCLALFLVVVSSDCSKQPSPSSQYNSSSNTTKIDLSEDIRDVENWIRDRSEDFSLQNLKEMKLPGDEFELRIWAAMPQGSGLNCFILHKKNKKWEASKVSARILDDKGFGKTPKGQIVVKKNKLPAPLSGWAEVNKILVEKGIGFPLPYAWEAKQSPVEDESAVSLEIKEGENYSLVSYGTLTESKDGKTVLDICNYLAKEFAMEIGCGYR